MDNADISLNVMIDTVGSNVITTSMAMGLAMVVSDVGSIRDYCSEDNSMFCNSVQDFSTALKKLSADPTQVVNMRKASLMASRRLSIRHFHNELQAICIHS